MGARHFFAVGHSAEGRVSPFPNERSPQGVVERNLKPGGNRERGAACVAAMGVTGAAGQEKGLEVAGCGARWRR